MYRLFSLLSFVALLGGCTSTPNVSTDFNPAYDFSAKHSFALVRKASTGNGAAQSNDLLSNRIESAITTALAARGFKVVEPAQADMLVSFFVTSQSKTDIRTYNDGFSYRRCWSISCNTMATTVDVRNYEEGTLFIDFIDPASRELQWRGLVSKRLSSKRTSAERDKLIRESVEAVLATFPPKPN